MLELSTVVPSAFKAAVAFGISVSVLQIFPLRSSRDFTMSVSIIFSIFLILSLIVTNLMIAVMSWWFSVLASLVFAKACSK